MKLTEDEIDNIIDEVLIWNQNYFYKRSDLYKKIKSILSGVDKPTLDRIEQILTTASPARSAEEIAAHLTGISICTCSKPYRDRSKKDPCCMHCEFWDDIIKAMHAYAAQFRPVEVTDEEIEEHIYSVYAQYLDDDKDREFIYTVRACRGAMRSMAKWLRSKMKGE